MSKQKIPPSAESMISETFKWMIYTGTNPTKQSLFTKIYTRVLLLLVFVTFILQSVQQFNASYSDLGDVIIDIVMTVGFWQIFVKVYTCHTRSKMLLNMNERINEKFWTSEFLPVVEQQFVRKIYRYSTFIANMYAYVVSSTLVAHYSSSYLKNRLITNIWLPDRDILLSSTIYDIIFVIQAIMMTIATLCGLVQLDKLFMIMSGLTLAQFRMLKYRLSTIGTDLIQETEFKKIIECVKHHNVLLKFYYCHQGCYACFALLLSDILSRTLADIETVYSPVILNMFGTDLILAVISLLGLLVEKNAIRFVAFVVIYITVAGQIFLYCLFGQFVEDETVSVADAAYNSKWVDVHDSNVRMGLIMIIRRSQRVVHITMGGFMNLCLDSFSNVARMMLSLLTLMLNMKEEGEGRT